MTRDWVRLRASRLADLDTELCRALQAAHGATLARLWAVEATLGNVDRDTAALCGRVGVTRQGDVKR